MANREPDLENPAFKLIKELPVETTKKACRDAAFKQPMNVAPTQSPHAIFLPWHPPVSAVP
ncbi:MAG: hypothetical protein ACOC1D_02390, partial [Prolixibacteraceae bacterium]